MVTEKEMNQLLPGSRWFRLGEALWLPKWGVHAVPAELAWYGILRVAMKMDRIREMFNRPITITSWYRPEEYNRLIRGAMRSAHIEGLAVDFVVSGLGCDEVRGGLLPRLDALDIRMEDLPGSTWVHVDGREPGPTGRYFKP